ncbi:MAG: hypothetical protein V4561_06120 [Bacteroidota bacterium]
MINKAICHAVMLKQHSFDTLNFVKGTKNNNLEIFLLIMLDRLHNSSKSLELLLNQYSKHPTHEFAIGIILRSALLDTIISINLFNILEENKEHPEKELKNMLEEAAEKYLGDGFDKIINNLERDLNNGFFAAEELSDTYNNLVRQYPTFFKEYNYDGSKPTVKHKNIQQKKLYETIANSATLKNLSDIVNKYEFFSKYDHFTLIHYQMIRQSKEDREKRIVESFEHLIFHSILLHNLIKEVYPEDFFVKQHSLIGKYCEEKIINERIKS